MTCCTGDKLSLRNESSRSLTVKLLRACVRTRPCAAQQEMYDGLTAVVWLSSITWTQRQIGMIISPPHTDLLDVSFFLHPRSFLSLSLLCKYREVHPWGRFILILPLGRSFLLALPGCTRSVLCTLPFHLRSLCLCLLIIGNGIKPSNSLRTMSHSLEMDYRSSSSLQRDKTDILWNVVHRHSARNHWFIERQKKQKWNLWAAVWILTPILLTGSTCVDRQRCAFPKVTYQQI